MSVINSLISNKKKSNKYLINMWLNRLNINQKIIFGYAIAIGISFAGITVGTLIGNYRETQAIEVHKYTLAETTSLHKLQTGVLQVRTHQQQLIPLIRVPKDFQKEYIHIRKHASTIKDSWSKIIFFIDKFPDEDEKKLKLVKFLNTYKQVPAMYLQELDVLVKKINIEKLKSEAEVREAQELLLKFTNSSLAIKFDGISDDLNELLAIFYWKSENAEKELIRVLILRNWIVILSISFSIAIAFFLTTQISRGISRPILKLGKFAQKVTKEENFDLQISINTDDEIGQLGSSFNHLILEVRQLLQEQKESTAHLRAIIDNLADGLLVSDIEGNIINFNPAITRMFCLGGDIDISGINCYDFLPEIGNHLIQAQKNPQTVFNTEFELTKDRIGKASITGILEANPEDKLKNINLENSNSHNSNLENIEDENVTYKYIGSVILIRDITQEKEIDRMKTDFISTVSHELRTPLTSVLGFASIIQEKLEEDIFPLLSSDNRKTKKTIRRVRDNIGIIIAEAERLTSLINDVLDIAKMEAGKLEWKKESVQIEKLIEHSLLVTSGLFQGGDLEVISDVESGLPDIIGDRDRLMQVIINLISNAVKFTYEGSVTCRVRRIEQHIVVSITDTGSGITPEDQQRVFEKFKQIGETLTDKPKGTGLGLPICKQIIEYHGGNIWVESQIDIGSTFSFSLPIHERSDISELEKIINLDSLVRQLQENSTNSPHTYTDEKTILVVDDDNNIRELLRQSLEVQGYTVNEAKDGLDAINKIKLAKPDLIILDGMMPQINGFDAAAILKHNPSTMHIPIIMLSIFEDKERGYLLGIDRYLTKPIESQKLISEINSLLSQDISTKKVLVVDKNSSTLLTLSEVLQTQGYNVVEASNGEDCI
ncbi:MAG: ATP-binding protein [Mastigocoleus sp.]